MGNSIEGIDKKNLGIEEYIPPRIEKVKFIIFKL